ncbi:hypothetical protein JIN85_09555 [Luteolibacter pohnpeiensis]|uniref:Uncharacterized protein n=1 Tax=Luteolibacter pohnpeiensis TaxID=454153 RepID=A0A934S5K6_9BACT|nr:hypothetical protein [Luteolibacter pohnpeiensis]MBK1882662.1 hypothetical protein [Luteolibacter pohnpeiensis]
MKIAAWIGAGVVIILLAFFTGARNSQISAVEARNKIVALGNEPGITLIDTKQFEGDAILGSRIEKKLRDLLHVNKRETPLVIEDYHFRGPSGAFTVQLLDKTGEPAEISVYGIPTESTATGRLLRKTFPMVDFVAKP